MNMRKVLKIITVSFILLGVGGIIHPFIYSLKPSKEAEAKLPKLDISSLEKGDYKVIKHLLYGEMYNGYDWGILIYRKNNGDVLAWDLPIKNNKIGMPDLKWYRPFYNCTNFGPTVINGLVDETFPIKCHDQALPSDWWKKSWGWDINGKSLNSYVEDMRKTKAVVEGKYLVLGKSNS